MNTIAIPWHRMNLGYVLSRFVGLLDADKCWEWAGSKNNFGYGRYGYMTDDGRRTWLGAHRILYELVYGPIPPGMLVCHHCDNPTCVRPSHLFIGNTKDNMRDASHKGRTCTGEKNMFYGGDRRGEKSHTAKLTTEQVVDIRQRYSEGESYGKLAAQFAVTPSNILCIVKRKSWCYV